MSGAALLLFDGRCGLCNRLVKFVLRRDKRDRFVFAPLQSPLAAEILARHGRDARDLDTLCVVLDRGAPGERVLVKGRAALHVLARLGAAWPLLAALGRPLPTRLLDLLYDFVARRRIRWFGRTETCLVPTPAQRAKFLTTEMTPGPADVSA
jgi:predicted DCC family thiol-disulfide oxidoreductase YuxK